MLLCATGLFRRTMTAPTSLETPPTPFLYVFVPLVVEVVFGHSISEPHVASDLASRFSLSSVLRVPRDVSRVLGLFVARQRPPKPPSPLSWLPWRWSSSSRVLVVSFHARPVLCRSDLVLSEARLRYRFSLFSWSPGTSLAVCHAPLSRTEK